MVGAHTRSPSLTHEFRPSPLSVMCWLQQCVQCHYGNHTAPLFLMSLRTGDFLWLYV